MSDEANTFDGLMNFNGTLLVIPADRYEVKKVTVEEIDRLEWDTDERSYHCPSRIEYHVKQRPDWRPPSFAVSSGE